MADPTVIDRLYKEAVDISAALTKGNEISLSTAAADNWRKSLLLATASYFEHRICEIVLGFISEESNGSAMIQHFVRNKAIARQYHTWFNWDGNNANQFFGFFGADFRAAMEEQVKSTEQLKLSIRAFLELGNERNRLVHQDYGSFQLEKTLDEIYLLYKTALHFVDSLPAALRQQRKEPA